MRMCLSLYEEKSLFFDARQFRHGCAQGVAACCFQKNYTARMERAQIGGFEQMSVFSLHRRLCRNRAFWFLLLLILSFFILSSCSSDDTGDKDGISIVCANFAGYDFTKEVLDIVNKERAKVGVEPLKMDTKLFETAQQRAAELAVLFSHTRPNLTDCFSVFPTGLKRKAENIAAGIYGNETPEEVMVSWMESPGQKGNI